MKKYFSNTGYFIRETKTIIQSNLISNIFSIISISLVFFILTMIISAWRISSEVVNAIQDEAEISVYFNEGIQDSEVTELMGKINAVYGVEHVKLVNESEAYDRMVEILDKEAKVLEHFNDNPFSSFIEIKINLSQIDTVIENLSSFNQIEHIRDNREVLNRISNISEILKVLGYLVVVAAGISTVVIISHIIRMGIYNSREHIYTLRLLGSPEIFIACPYLLEGILLTLGGSTLALILSVHTIEYIYGQITGPLPFIPLPSKDTMTSTLTILVMSSGAILGTIGSILGISSAKSE